MRIERGLVVSARRAFGDDEAESPRPAAPVAGLPVEFLCAFGAARGADGRAQDVLAPGPIARGINVRRRRRVLAWAVAAAIALGLALFSFDRARERYLGKLDARLTELAPEMEAAQRARVTLDNRRSANQLAQRIGATRADPLGIMSILSRALPRDAFVTALRFKGDEWEVDGTAAHANAIIPALDAEKQLENVRFRSATSRFRDAGQIRESFAIGFRARVR